MTTYAICAADGALVSVGTVVADPLPDGLAAVAMSDADVAALAAGGTWDAEALTVAPAPEPEPDPTEARIADLEATVAALLAIIEGA